MLYSLASQRSELAEYIAVPRYELRTSLALDVEHTAKAVVLQLEQPIGVVKGGPADLERQRLNVRQRCSRMRVERHAPL